MPRLRRALLIDLAAMAVLLAGPIHRWLKHGNPQLTYTSLALLVVLGVIAVVLFIAYIVTALLGSARRMR